MDWLNVLMFAGVGFVAQMIDGALGMAYGVSSTTFLLSLGVSPALASASVHTAEIVTSGISGFSHFKFGNVNKSLFKRLVIPGVIGGAIGAYILSSLDVPWLKPVVAFYLLAMGVIIIIKAFTHVQKKEENEIKGVVPLAVVGGFFDAIGGGGWGPIVTSTLMARGNHPRETIGTVNLAEFFVCIAEVALFILTLTFGLWEAVIGLIIGGAIAAPLAALITSKLPHKPLMIIVGLLIVGLQVRTLILYFAG